jgi:hypothetical protein
VIWGKDTAFPDILTIKERYTFRPPGVAVAEGVGWAVSAPWGVTVGVGDAEGVSVGISEGMAPVVGVVVGLGVIVAVGGTSVGVPVGVTEGVGVGDGVSTPADSSSCVISPDLKLAVWSACASPMKK